MLPPNVKAVVTYEAEIPKEGRGKLYLLSDGMLFDVRGKGIRFETHFDHVVKFWVVSPDKFFLKVRKWWGCKSIVFKIHAQGPIPSLPGLLEIELEFTIQQYKKILTLQDKARKIRSGKQNVIDTDLFYHSEQIWLECNWERMMTFVKPERVVYLNDFIHNARIGSPYMNPYELITKFENLTYDDFSNLAGFLNWRYGDMTKTEIDLIVSLFRDLRNLTITRFELEVELQSRLKHYRNWNRSLYEHVSIILHTIKDRAFT